MLSDTRLAGTSWLTHLCRWRSATFGSSAASAGNPVELGGAGRPRGWPWDAAGMEEKTTPGLTVSQASRGCGQVMLCLL